jgi:4-amino-4-deoxy-L-arabinose transferase-like glycosyltransferase
MAADILGIGRKLRALEAWIAGTAGEVAHARYWSAPLAAAVIAFVAGAPGVFGLPTLDRDEARFAQATAQMLETGDYVNIRFQDQPRDKKPVGIHWLQAASVKLTSSVEKREIWAYRLPSLAGAMLAAAACAWGAAAFFGARAGMVAGAILGATLILSTEASIAKTDAALCGFVTLAMAALGRIYGSVRGATPTPGRATYILMWSGLAGAVIVKGPIGPMVFGLALVALALVDREARWMRRLGWGWGLVLVAAIAGPWAVAITVATDGAFWGSAIAGDLAPKLAGGHESHGAPPGLHALLAVLLLFPAGMLLPAALATGWRERLSPGVRFALAWLIPAWLVFELMPTKLPHYTLPLYGALAWLMAASLRTPMGRWVCWPGAALSLAGGAALAAVVLVAAHQYGAPGAEGWAVAAAVALIAAGAMGAGGLALSTPATAILGAGLLGLLGHGLLAAGVAPRLDTLWVSRATAAMLDRDHLNPRDGVTPGPVAVAGFAEPSLVFALGTETSLDGVDAAVEALRKGQPALIESREDKAFRAALAKDGTKATQVDAIKGVNYSTGRAVTLSLWAPPDDE